MEGYVVAVERKMNRLYNSLSEKDKRRYAGIEALKLGHGGIEYISGIFGCDPKTIRQGQLELEGTEELDTVGIRKKGVDAKRQ
jgi:hypothetical protein